MEEKSGGTGLIFIVNHYLCHTHNTTDMNIAILKYNAGNIYSVENALRRIGISPVLTDDKEKLCSADGIIFPGQGEASSAMKHLREQRLDDLIRNLRQPLLGICIGQQLLCRHSEEGDVDCLGIFNAEVKKFRPHTNEEKIPVMGWNEISCKENPLFTGLDDIGKYVYFIHSYYVPVCGETVATANYIETYSAAMQKANFYATQFHPEKSGRVGERIIENFVNLCTQP